MVRYCLDITRLQSKVNRRFKHLLKILDLVFINDDTLDHFDQKYKKTPYM